VALIQVSPPDDKGRCSLGISVDVVKAAAENAGLVIAQVNDQMPRTCGDEGLHVYDIDILVPLDGPLQEVEPAKTSETTRQIGQHLASLVEDGSTLELGIGEIPQALFEFLRSKKNLGIHTEMFTDEIIDLIEDGIITGSEKTLDRGKIVASFCMGSARLYNYIHGNPKFVFKPTDYVNNPLIIAQQPRMVAINTALQVDLTGQVCADSLGSKFFSGFGGQLDFNRGAAMAKGGKAIIALPATAMEGKVSRIVSQLSPGAGVVTTRADVHYVVTEYGVAYLHGKNVQERALALISIAHPDSRAQLLREAIELKYVRQDMATIEGKIKVGPPPFRTAHVLADGTEITFRAILPTDAPLVKDLLYQLSEQTIYYRFFTHLKRFPTKQIQDFVYVDSRHDVAIVGTLPDAGGERIVAIGRYYLDEKTNRAEVAFVVADEWQNRGIGTGLHRYLMRIAKGQGISGFRAEVLRDNKAMQAVFNKSGCRVASRMNGNCYSYEIEFD
jgi:RimJ/RimL family protein N-acetyltransferase/acyl CoA:acetate/3-ketoacid CoA transferase beta subunit